MNEIVENYQKKNKFQNVLSRVNIIHVVIVGLLLFILIKMGKSGTDPKYYYVGYAVLGVIIAIMYFKAGKNKKLIPRHVAAQIAQEELNRMVRDGKEFAFDSKCVVMAASQMKYKDDLIKGESGVPISWAIGFYEMVHGSNYKREGLIHIHPYEGYVMGIKMLPLGYTGAEETDRIKIVPVGIVSGSFKTSEFGGEPKI